MEEKRFWLQYAIFRLHELLMNGSAFKEELWELDWDDSLSDEENGRNEDKYEFALMTLMQAKVVGAAHKPSMEGDDPKTYLWYLEWFDYESFLQFCDRHGFSQSDPGTRSVGRTKSTREDTRSTRASNLLALHKLEPKHYYQRTGILALSANNNLAVTARGKVTRPDGTKYLQCLVMEKLFKNVKAIKYGVSFSTILSVHDSKIDKKAERKISNTVAEINKKAAAVGGPDKLIVIQNKKVLVNNSYL